MAKLPNIAILAGLRWIQGAGYKLQVSGKQGTKHLYLFSFVICFLVLCTPSGFCSARAGLASDF
jgi:hypothetical protein